MEWRDRELIPAARAITQQEERAVDAKIPLNRIPFPDGE